LPWLAIGKGAKQEILEQMKMVGVNNILINPVIPEKSSTSTDQGRSSRKNSQEIKYARCGINQGDNPLDEKD